MKAPGAPVLRGRHGVLPGGEATCRQRGGSARAWSSAISLEVRSVRLGFSGQVVLGNSVSQVKQVAHSGTSQVLYNAVYTRIHMGYVLLPTWMSPCRHFWGNHLPEVGFHGSVLGNPCMCGVHLGDCSTHILTLGSRPRGLRVLGTPNPSMCLAGYPLAILSWLRLGWAVSSAQSQVSLVFLSPQHLPLPSEGSFSCLLSFSCPSPSGPSALIYSEFHISALLPSVTDPPSFSPALFKSRKCSGLAMTL